MRHLWVYGGLALAGCTTRAPAPSSAPSTSAAAVEAAPSASGRAAVAASSAGSAGPSRLLTNAIALPGASGALALDYLAVDRGAGRVWVPAAGTGSVDVVEAATNTVTRVQGFATVEREGPNGKRTVGPSSVTIGEGVAYVGNRANAEICAVDLGTLKKGACVTLATAPDGILYVPTTKEVWATTPKDSSIAVLDASTPAKLVPKDTIHVQGSPEGYAVDATRGIFFTNLEDKDKTLVIDARTRKVSATWDPHCGSEGPRGLAIDVPKSLLFVACTDQVEVLDAAHGGAELATLPIGKGIDNIDYVESRRELFVAAGGPATVHVVHVEPSGLLEVSAIGATAPGVRVVVATADGAAYAADGKQGRLLALTRAK